MNSLSSSSDFPAGATWTAVKLKYLVDEAKTGALSPRSEAGGSNDPWVKLAEVTDGSMRGYYLPVVRPCDVMNQPQMAILDAPQYGVFPAWNMDDMVRAPAESLVFILDTATGGITGCKLLHEPVLVASSVLFLTPKATVESRWLRHVLMGLEPGVDMLGTGRGLEALMQRPILTPPHDEQIKIADEIDRLLPVIFEVELALHRQADLVAERRIAMVQSLVLGLGHKPGALPTAEVTQTAETDGTNWPRVQKGSHRPR